MQDEHEIPTFEDHIDPQASRRYFQAFGTFPPEIKHGESPQSIHERIEGIRRLCDEPFMDEEATIRFTNELGFLQDSVQKLGNITLKG